MAAGKAKSGNVDQSDHFYSLIKVQLTDGIFDARVEGILKWANFEQNHFETISSNSYHDGTGCAELGPIHLLHQPPERLFLSPNGRLLDHRRIMVVRGQGEL